MRDALATAMAEKDRAVEEKDAAVAKAVAEKDAAVADKAAAAVQNRLQIRLLTKRRNAEDFKFEKSIKHLKVRFKHPVDADAVSVSSALARTAEAGATQP